MAEQQQSPGAIKLSPPSEIQQEHSAFSMAGFEFAQRLARMIASSQFVPERFQGDKNIANVMIALEFANRLNVSPLMVMQNMYVVYGNPAFSSKYCIAQLNTKYSRYGGIKFNWVGERGTMDWGCYVTVENPDKTIKAEGTLVTMQMAKDEGWLDKKGSKWVTMPQKMLKYRAASFFANEEAPEILMGIKTDDEVLDIEEAVVVQPVDKAAERVQIMLAKVNTVEELEQLKPRIKPEQMPLFETRFNELNTQP